MITSNPKVCERHNRIIENLNRTGRVKVSQLSEELGATTVTIRHDLDVLEQGGLLGSQNQFLLELIANESNKDSYSHAYVG